MISWGTLVCHALWVVGLATVLATVSLGSYEGKPTHFRVPLAIGLLLVCAGMFGLGSALWERALWGLVAVLLLVELGHGYVRPSRGKTPSVEGR